jgi:hypothetical protein
MRRVEHQIPSGFRIERQLPASYSSMPLSTTLRIDPLLVPPRCRHQRRAPRRSRWHSWLQQLPFLLIPPVSDNLESRLDSVLAKQANRVTWNQHPGAVDGLDFQEAAYEPGRKFSDAIECPNANEADILIQPIMICFSAIDVVPSVQVNQSNRNLLERLRILRRNACAF